MDLHQANTSLHGVVQGISYGQNERVDELNNRYAARQFPDIAIKPQFDIRAVPTKYSLFPLIDRRPSMQGVEPIKQYLDHSQETNFCPNIAKGPYSGFSNKVEVESSLRNQFFAIQRGADQGVYVPSSASDMYKVPVYGRQEAQTHPTISAQFAFDGRVHANLADGRIGQDRFHNNTRTQLRNTVSQN